MTDPDELAAAVRAWRGKTLSQKAAAERLGLSKRTYEGIEQGRGFAYPQLLLAVLKMTPLPDTPDSAAKKMRRAKVIRNVFEGQK